MVVCAPSQLWHIGREVGVGWSVQGLQRTSFGLAAQSTICFGGGFSESVCCAPATIMPPVALIAATISCTSCGL
jgi:hypothetical protein